jgi:predicted CoA-binding protein
VIMMDAVDEFLSGSRFAVVGASEEPGSIGHSVYRALRGHGYEVVPVNPNADSVDGDRCYPAIGGVPGPIDGVVIIVNAADAVGVVGACALMGIRRVWLFRGLGAKGAVSDDALALCADLGISVVAGACPLMFLEPVHGVHRMHRSLRHLNHSLESTR